MLVVVGWIATCQPAAVATCALGDFALHPPTPLEWKCTHLMCTSHPKQSLGAAFIANAKCEFARFAFVHSRVNKFCAAI